MTFSSNTSLQHTAHRWKSFATALVAAMTMGISIVAGVAAHADSGIENLRTCLATPNSELDVVVLMDKSGSMRTSDKTAARSTMVATSLRLLANVASINHKYRARLISWGGKSDRTAPSVGWTEINGEQDPDIQRVAEAAKANNARYTDWSFALEQAKQAFDESEVNAEKACRLVLWMTDGALDTNDKNRPDGTIIVDQTEQAALNSICVGDSTKPAAIDWFRRHNVLILGALLQNGMPSANKSASNLFKAVVEGRTEISPGTASAYGINPSYTCGDQSGVLGQVQEGSDASTLAWKFIDLVAQARGLTPLGGNGSTIYVDAGLGRVVIYSQSSQDPEITDATGRQICPGPTCNSSRIGGGLLTVTTVTGESRYGNWIVTVPGRGKSAAFAQLAVPKLGNLPAFGLVTRVSGHSGRVYEGEQRSVAVDLLQGADGTPFPLKQYASAEVCFSAGNASGFENPRCQPASLARITFPWTAGQAQTAIKIDVRIRSARGPEFTDHVVKQVQVAPNTSLPQLQCSNMRDGICFLEDIPNQNKSALTSLVLVGGDAPATVANWSCGQLTAGDLFHRTFDCSVNSPNAQTRSSVTVAAKQSVPLTVSIALAQRSGESQIACDEDAVRGALTYTVQSETGRNIVRQQPIAFCTLAEKNFIVVVLAYLLLLALGVGIPLALLLVHARRAAVFKVPDGSLRWALVKVLIDETGIKSVGESGPEVFAVPRYSDMSGAEGLSNARTITVGPVTFVATPPKWNPFDHAKFEVTAADGSSFFWLGSTSGGTDAPQQSRLRINDQIVGLWLFRFSDTGLNPSSLEDAAAEATPSFLQPAEPGVSSHLAPATGALDAELVLFADFADFANDLKRFQAEIPDSTRWERLWGWVEQERLRRLEQKNEAEAHNYEGKSPGSDSGITTNPPIPSQFQSSDLSSHPWGLDRSSSTDSGFGSSPTGEGDLKW